MSLRRSFFDVNGNPIHRKEELREFLDEYAPMDGSGSPFEYLPASTYEFDLERQKRAKLNFLASTYPEVPIQDAIVMHQRAARFSGDLKFRKLGQSGLIASDVIQACQEFRNSCAWWQNGERLTAVMKQDADEFRSIACQWELDLRQTGLENAKRALKREVELSCQFASSVLKAIENTKDWVGMNQVEKRTAAFKNCLEHEFTFFNL